MLVLFLLLACEPECGPETESTCDTDQRCLWVGDYECRIDCVTDEDCPDSQTCTGTAPSCAFCADIHSYCE